MIDTDMLLACLDGPTANIRDLAAAMLQGEDLWFALHDALLEAGFDGSF